MLATYTWQPVTSKARPFFIPPSHNAHLRCSLSPETSCVLWVPSCHSSRLTLPHSSPRKWKQSGNRSFPTSAFLRPLRGFGSFPRAAAPSSPLPRIPSSPSQGVAAAAISPLSRSRLCLSFPGLSRQEAHRLPCKPPLTSRAVSAARLPDPFSKASSDPSRPQPPPLGFVSLADFRCQGHPPITHLPYVTALCPPAAVEAVWAD